MNYFLFYQLTEMVKSGRGTNGLNSKTVNNVCRTLHFYSHIVRLNCVDNIQHSTRMLYAVLDLSVIFDTSVNDIMLLIQFMGLNNLQ